MSVLRFVYSTESDALPELHVGTARLSVRRIRWRLR
jgi:hypothetical protein